MPSRPWPMRPDPWYGLEGTAARRLRLRKRLTADLAIAFAVVACGLTVFAWIERAGVLGLLP